MGSGSAGYPDLVIDFGSDLVVLLIGAVLTFVIGTLLLRAGRPYLEEVFPDPKVARGVDRLLTVLFLLVTLGFLALISTADFGISAVYQRVMVKLGLELLIIGATYGMMIFVVSQIRIRRRQEEIADEISQQILRQRAGFDPLRPMDAQPDSAPADVPEEPPAGGFAGRRRPLGPAPRH